MENIKSIYLAVKKMYQNLKEKDKGLNYMAFFYMINLVIFDSIIVFSPKILLELYLNDTDKLQITRWIIIFLVVGSITGGLSNIIQERARARIGFLRIDYLADAFQKIITSSYEYMEDTTFFNKYDSAFDACSNSESGIEKVYNVLFELPALILKLLVLGSVLCYFSIIVVFMILLHLVVTFYLKKKSSSYKYEYREELSKVNRKKRYFNNVTQDFQYGKDIRLYNFKQILTEKYKQEILHYKTIFQKIKSKEYMTNLIGSITLLISDIAIYGMLIIKGKNGISIADITMYFMVTTIFMQTVNDIITNVATIYGEGLFVVDFFTFIDTNLKKEKGQDIQFQDRDTLEIELKNFSFKYPNTNRYIYKNLNLKIEAGEKIALVGDNGVGKSTLIKVLGGLFRNFEGEILIGGQDIRKISDESLFSLFSIVFQDVNLLSYTVAENIAGKENEIDRGKVWSVLEQVGLKSKVEALPKNIDQLIHKYIDKNGLELSGGEIQKMGIARALYKESKIFILDEPTAALDALAEKEIYEQFHKIANNKTTIFISHRLASTKFCDRIILLGSEGVLEQGTHEELMSLEGRYFEMFTLQGKYYQEREYEKNQVVF